MKSKPYTTTEIHEAATALLAGEQLKQIAARTGRKANYLGKLVWRHLSEQGK